VANNNYTICYLGKSYNHLDVTGIELSGSSKVGAIYFLFW